jgi:excisionase family DNA binding protein
LTNNAHRHRPRARTTIAAPAATVRNDRNNVIPIHRGGYSITDVAEILAVPSATVCAWARADLIPARKLGRRWVISRAQFDAWLDDLPAAADADFARERQRLDHAANRRRRQHHTRYP